MQSWLSRGGPVLVFVRASLKGKVSGDYPGPTHGWSSRGSSRRSSSSSARILFAGLDFVMFWFPVCLVGVGYVKPYTGKLAYHAFHIFILKVPEIKPLSRGTKGVCNWKEMCTEFFWKAPENCASPNQSSIHFFFFFCNNLHVLVHLD